MQQGQPWVWFFLRLFAPPDEVRQQNRARRDGRQKISRQLGLRQGEEKDGQQQPQRQEGAQVFGSRWLRDGEAPVADGVNHGGDGKYCPRDQRQQRNGQEVPERLMMVVEVGGGVARQVLPQEEKRKNSGLARCTKMNHGNVTARYSAMPIGHSVRNSSRPSRRRAANSTIINAARKTATGPLATVPSPRKK